MKTTTYICDCCKNSVGKDDILDITFQANLVKAPNSYYATQSIKKDVCKKCLEKKGLILEYNKETHEQDLKKNEKTMEDKLLEILEDLGVAFQE